MDYPAIEFDGQQTGERILATLTPYPGGKYFSLGLLMLAMLVVFVILISVASYVTAPMWTVGPVLFCLCLAVVIIGFWWNISYFGKTRTYLTDRRIVRFEAATPFTTTKRSLFWNEVLKTKAYASNMWLRIFRIGQVVVEPQLSQSENIIIRDVYLYDDVANYMDKILYLFKNKPEDIASLNHFVPKPRGKRD